MCREILSSPKYCTGKNFQLLLDEAAENHWAVEQGANKDRCMISE